ncbi:hypothetical protein ACQ4M3_26445 [Leptolyngbya sp. AN03gr2]|uniref:hypothetical protein n=1 Tax=unclassified Leptolyngbya TaxID=2650499 RepID=UPI003D321193
MSSIATFFRTLPDTLQQPAALAMLGSLGAHLLVFATLPAFTSSNEPRPEAEVRRVRLVEPPQGSPGSQIARSQAGLPPVPNTPSSRIQIPNAGTGTSPIPNPLYTIPDLTPIPVPNPPQRRSLSQNEVNDLLRRLAARQQPQQQQQNNPPKPPQTKPPSEFTTTQLPNLNPQNPANVETTPFPPGGTVPSAPLPQPSGTPQPAPTTAAQPAPTTDPQPRIDQAQLDRNIQMLAAMRFNSAGTTEQERLQTMQNLSQQLEKQYPDLIYDRLSEIGEKPKEIDSQLTFTPSDFNEHPPRPVSIGILVGRDGKPLPDQKPIVLSSTGYQFLNEKAIEYVQKDASQPNRFAPEAQIRLVIYELQFKLPNAQPTS